MPDEEDYRLPRTILSEALSSTPRLTPEEIKRWQETIIENKHYAAIGRAAVSWAFFESIVDGWSLNIAGIHMRPGLCFTAQIYGIGRKLETFISLARLRQLPSTLVVKLEDFYRRAKEAHPVDSGCLSGLFRLPRWPAVAAAGRRRGRRSLRDCEIHRPSAGVVSSAGPGVTIA
jgi:hypothetical protein